MTTASDATRSAPELRDVHETERLGRYLDGIWERRSYIWYVAQAELRSRQVNDVLGNLWYLLTPVISIAIYYLIFGLILGIDRGVGNLILFLSVGVFLFQFTQRATTASSLSIIRNVGLIKAFSFPRAILPITTTLVETLASATSFLVIFAVAFLTGQPPRWQWVLLVPIVAVQSVFNLGLGMVVARATAHVRDVQQVLPFIFRLLFYGSGVIFNVSAYAEGNRTMEILFALNPLYCFISVARWAILDGYEVLPEMLIFGSLWTVGLLIFGFLWFRAGEGSYSRE